ncbi:MAG: hypothetical protein KGJ57_09060 [Sphingomonadales bacterium]|nr:hypothetical protein [Sphingomonadales bacterium]MDE2169560.1 hypothetical protein [Sphingomonadales bacterium]
MFICVLTYTAPAEDVAALRPAHLAFLKEQHAAGHFIGWGRQASGQGGVIFAKGTDRAVVEAVEAGDPYLTGGVASVEVIEMNVAFLSPDFVADVTT